MAATPPAAFLLLPAAVYRQHTTIPQGHPALNHFVHYATITFCPGREMRQACESPAASCAPRRRRMAAGGFASSSDRSTAMAAPRPLTSWHLGAMAVAEEQRLARRRIATGDLIVGRSLPGQALYICDRAPDIVGGQRSKAGHLSAGDPAADGLKQVVIARAMSEPARVQRRSASAAGAFAMAGSTGGIENFLTGRLPRPDHRAKGLTGVSYAG